MTKRDKTSYDNSCAIDYFVIVLATLCLVFLAADISRNSLWKSKLLLLGDTFTKCPSKVRVITGFGEVYASNGDYDRATTLFNKALSIDPDFADAHVGMGLILLKRSTMAGKGPAAAALLESSVIEFAAAMKTRPGHPKALSGLANALFGLGRPEQAIDIYKRMLAQKPNLSSARYNLGIIYQSLGMYDDAAKEYLQVTLLEPDKTDPLNNLAIIYVERGQLEPAIEMFKRILRIDPNNADALYNLGLTYERLGAKDMAKRAYEEAARVRPGFTEALNAARAL